MEKQEVVVVVEEEDGSDVGQQQAASPPSPPFVQQQAMKQQQQNNTGPRPSLPWRPPSSPPLDDFRDVNENGNWGFNEEMTDDVGALVTKSDSCGTWRGVKDEKREDGDEDVKKRTGIGTGYMVGIFGH